MDTERAVSSVLWWKRQAKGKSVSEGEENIEVRRFPEGVVPAQVSVAEAVTASRNYQSVKVEVGISLPAMPEEIDEVYEYALARVKKKLGEEIKAARGEYNI